MNKLFSAVMYYSRLPVPKGVKCDPRTLSESLRYFPLVGLIVGALGSGGYWLSGLVLPHNVSVVVAMAVMILSTGALHEDGFADFCDGFGGGYGKENILRIMKDSHIGTYGVIGLIFSLLVRYLLLCEVNPTQMVAVMIISQGASRFGSLFIVRTSSYARVEPSKSSHSALGLSLFGFVVGMVIAFVPLVWFGALFTGAYIGSLLVVTLLFRAYIYSQIEGFTGDTLGALQQMLEVLFYVLILTLM